VRLLLALKIILLLVSPVGLSFLADPKQVTGWQDELRFTSSCPLEAPRYDLLRRLM
jgi:hypothetical protein